jgi:hypothetical protein
MIRDWGGTATVGCKGYLNGAAQHAEERDVVCIAQRLATEPQLLPEPDHEQRAS